MKKIYGRYQPRESAIALFPNAKEELSSVEDGETVLITVEKKRTHDAHSRFFARINDYYKNAPEKFDFEPWASKADFFRKHYLIKAGFCDVKVLHVYDYGAVEAVIAALKAFSEYSVIEHKFDPVQARIVLEIKKAKSQCFAKMSQSEFLQSAQEVEDCIVADFGFCLPEKELPI